MSFRTQNQFLSVQDFEYVISTEGHFDSLDDFFDTIDKYPGILAVEEKSDILKIIKTHYKDKIRHLIGRAEQITENCFDLLGSGPTYLGAKIDWHQDFKSGRVWNRDYYLNVPQIYWGDHSDAKVPWELSRFHYLYDLALAYNLTGIKKYLDKFIALIEDWIYENACPFGINWVNPMEASIRAINWLTAYEMIDKEIISDNFKSRFYNLLYQHGLFIWENLASFGPGINNNNYLYDLTGLLVLGRLFKSLPDGEKWYEFAHAELEKEIFNQISPDGTCYESSLNYQIIMLELYLFAINFEKRNGQTFSEEFKARIMQSCAALYYLSKPDETVPNFGDSGSDRLFRMADRDERDIGYLLDLAGIIIDLKGFTQNRVRPAVELLWLTGLEGFRNYFDNLVVPRREKKSMYFADSGLAVCRQKENYLGFFANAVGEIGIGGHKHNDILAIEFSHGKDNFIVDSGTFVYTGDPSGRNFFRKTGSHSTLEVDSQEINRFLPKILFSIRGDAEVRDVVWESDGERDYISAEHSGYARLDNPVVIKRSLHFNKQNQIYCFRDQFMGNGEHTLYGHLILDNEIKTVIKDNHALLMTPSGKIAVVVMADPDWTLEMIPHFISKRYGQKLESWKLRYSRQAKTPQTCLWGLFVADSQYQITSKLNRFYNNLHKLKWEPERVGRLVLKRGSEFVMSARMIEELFVPGLDQLRRESRKVELTH